MPLFLGTYYSSPDKTLSVISLENKEKHEEEISNPLQVHILKTMAIDICGCLSELLTPNGNRQTMILPPTPLFLF